jgi:hypothetical protein
MLVPSQIARRGDELKWWQQLNVDPLQTAQRLWQQTRPRGSTARFAGS